MLAYPSGEASFTSEGKRVTTEILINVAPRENRAALIENGVLTELFVERQSRRGIVSNL